jgi:type-F conjugative transfer system protein TrbI
MSEFFKSKSFAVVLSVLLTTLLCFYYNSKPTIVVFNQGKAVSALASELTNRKLSENAKSLLIAKFSSVMKHTLVSEAKEHNFTIISSKYVLAGSRDITSDLLPKIAAKLKLSLKRGEVSS